MPLTPLADAQKFVLDSCQVLPTISVPLADAIGCVVAIDMVSGEAIPPFDNSAVDGFAVIAADTAIAPSQLRVVGTLAAGAEWPSPIQRGTALKIMTGAPIPGGADAVVMVEDSVMHDDTVTLSRSVRPADGLRRSGSDVLEGDLVFPAGTVLSAAHLGVVASLGITHPSVIRRPRVAVLSTGDELVGDGSPLGPGQIRDSNRVSLVALLAEAGVTPIDVGLLRDDEALLEATLRDAVEQCDAIVTSGGVSMGDYDVVKAVLSRIADMTWMQIDIKPAKPFAFGLLGRLDGTQVPIFGLPGNPVSSLVGFELLARPALKKMMGYTNLNRLTLAATVVEPLRRNKDGKTHFIRVTAVADDTGRLVARPQGAQGSHHLKAMADANALAVVPDGDTVPVGAVVPVIILR